jgi:hypothetical protein
MASTQSNQRQAPKTRAHVAPVVLYVADQGDVSAFQFGMHEAGYKVYTVATAEEALTRVGRIRLDVVVIGHGLTFAGRLQIEEAARRLRPKPRIILLYDTSISQTEQADAVLNVTSGPQHLVQTIRYLLTGSD